MQIQTALFGRLDVAPEKIIHFPQGIPGFEDLHEFAIVILEQTRPFLWLQALDEDVALPVISPFDIAPDYSPQIDDEVFNTLKISREGDLLVLSVAVIPEQISRMTANMAAPVLINIADNLGREGLVEGGDYQVRQPIFA